MYININLDATAVNNQVQMRFDNSVEFGGNRLLTPIGRLVVLQPPPGNPMRPTLGGGMQHIPGAFMFHPQAPTGQVMLENGLFTFNQNHEDILKSTAERLVKILTEAVADEYTTVTVMPFGGHNNLGTDIHVRFVAESDQVINFEKFPSGWRVWDVTTQAWEEFKLDFNKEGVFSLNEFPKFVTLYLGLGEVAMFLDEAGNVCSLSTPENVTKFGVKANNEIFQYLKVADR